MIAIEKHNYAVEYTEQDKFETNMIRIDQLITTLIFINPTLIQQCYNKEN